jgi:hypothetical protein
MVKRAVQNIRAFKVKRRRESHPGVAGRGRRISRACMMSPPLQQDEDGRENRLCDKQRVCLMIGFTH